MDNTYLEDVNKPKPRGITSSGPGNIHLSINGIEIKLKEVSYVHMVETTLDNNDDYRLIYMLNGSQIDSQVIPEIMRQVDWNTTSSVSRTTFTRRVSILYA